MSEIGAAQPRVPRGRPMLRAGVIASLLLLLLGFASIIWTPHDVTTVDATLSLQDVSSAHWLGTDPLGRDIFSLLMKGTLTSFVVAAVAVFIGAVVGVPLGFAAANWGEAAAWSVLRVNDFLLAIPALVIAVVLATLSGPSAVNVMFAVGIASIPVFARVTIAGAAVLKPTDYLAAAHLSGQGNWDATRRHVLPNLAALLIAQAITLLAVGVLAEASLSFVGLGTQPPATSLGLMLKDAQSYLLLKPSLAVVPGVVILLIVVALNLAADGLRDTLPPRLRRIGALRGTA